MDLEGTIFMTLIMDGLTTLVTITGKMFDLVTSNPYLCVFAAAGLAKLGLGMFKSGRKAVR